MNLSKTRSKITFLLISITVIMLSLTLLDNSTRILESTTEYNDTEEGIPRHHAETLKPHPSPSNTNKLS